MVQRYEQMRRLQWYKRGAAYHDLALSLTIKTGFFLEIIADMCIFAPSDNRGYVYVCTI